MQIKLPHHHHSAAGREGSQYSSHSAHSAPPPRRRDHRYSEEEIRILSEREDDRYHRRPAVRREEYIREELKEQQPRYCPIPTCFRCSLSLEPLQTSSLRLASSSSTNPPEQTRGTREGDLGNTCLPCLPPTPSCSGPGGTGLQAHALGICISPLESSLSRVNQSARN